MLNPIEQRPIRQSHLRVKTDLSEIAQVLEWIDQFKDSPLEPDIFLRVKLAIAEGFTNAVRHAHQHQPQDTPVDLCASLFAHQLEIQIWDKGAAFDLAALLDTVEQQYPNPTERHAHWGGTIFRKLSIEYGWKIEYHCPALADGERNCLQIQIPLRKHDAS